MFLNLNKQIKITYKKSQNKAIKKETCFNLFKFLFIPFYTSFYKKAIKKLINKINKTIELVKKHLDESKTLSLMFSDMYIIHQSAPVSHNC